MLIEALNWWAERMAELVPAPLTRQRSQWSDAIIIAAGQASGVPATVALRRNRQETSLGPFVPGSTNRGTLSGVARESAVLLRPPRGALLEKQLVLPIAAERDLRRVIGYEMNRATPFELDDVYWTCSVVQHDRARERLHVRLSLVPRAGLAPLLAALDEAGLAPTALEATPFAGPPRLIPLHQEFDRLAWQRRATVYLASACGLLGIAAIALPFLFQSLALGAVADRIAAVQPQIAAVQAVRKRMAAETAGQDAITEARHMFGNTLEVLAAVTQLLPDDTFLNDFTLRRRRLTITGQSASAPKLIAGLASDSMFRNPGFSAPVTRNEAAGRDVFSISAEVGP